MWWDCPRQAVGESHQTSSDWEEYSMKAKTLAQFAQTHFFFFFFKAISLLLHTFACFGYFVCFSWFGNCFQSPRSYFLHLKPDTLISLHRLLVTECQAIFSQHVIFWSLSDLSPASNHSPIFQLDVPFSVVWLTFYLLCHCTSPSFFLFWTADWRFFFFLSKKQKCLAFH